MLENTEPRDILHAGLIAERHPGLIRRIVAGGHELASHGTHQRDRPEPAAFFRTSSSRDRARGSHRGGSDGHRAPSWIEPTSGRSSASARRVQVQFQRLSDQADHYGMPDSPLRADVRARASSGARDDDAPLWLHRRRAAATSACCPTTSRWLLRRVNHVDRQPQYSIFTLGNDPAQPRLRDRCQDAISALTQPRSNGAPIAQAVVRFRVGPHKR